MVRELRFVLPRQGAADAVLTIATTLLDPLLYPKEKIAELYGVRWSVETHFAELKTTLRMRKVKSKTSQGVLKELTVYALVYNLIHVVMAKAAERQHVSPHRISFIDTVRWLLRAEPGETDARFGDQPASTRPSRAAGGERSRGHLHQDDPAARSAT